MCIGLTLRIESLVVGHFGKLNVTKVAAESQKAGKMTPASCTGHNWKLSDAHSKEI